MKYYLPYLYFLFFIYVLFRIIVTVFYKVSEKKYSKYFYEIQTVLNSLYADMRTTSYLLNIDEVDLKARQKYPNLFAKQEKHLLRIRMFSKVDFFGKTFGSLILCILSLLTIYFTEKNINNLFTVMEIIILPAIVSLFNTFFEFFEIDMNVGYESPYPKK